MKILLIGDYSGVHSELAKALRSKGHEVLVVSNGDGYKDYDRDIDIQGSYYKSFLGKFFNLICDFIGVKGLILFYKEQQRLNALKGFDVVQMINPIAIAAFGSIANILLVRKLKKHNNALFLCALGDDYNWVTQNLQSKFKYSALDNLNFKTLRHYVYSLRYAYGLFFQSCHKYIVHSVEKVIPGLLDYEMVYDNCEKLSHQIKLPISNELLQKAKLKLKELESNEIEKNLEKISIFHGWQNGKEYRKGNDKLHQAAKIVEKKFGTDFVKYNVVKSVPYNEYIKLFDDCDLFFDQTYSYDRGMNAVLGMASGKVVFSGFEKEIETTNITYIGVNAVPEVEQLVRDISFLIAHPEKMKAIKIEAIKYVITNHDSNKIADDYLNVWRCP